MNYKIKLIYFNSF